MLPDDIDFAERTAKAQQRLVDYYKKRSIEADAEIARLQEGLEEVLTWLQRSDVAAALYVVRTTLQRPLDCWSAAEQCRETWRAAASWRFYGYS